MPSWGGSKKKLQLDLGILILLPISSCLSLAFSFHGALTSCLQSNAFPFKGTPRCLKRNTCTLSFPRWPHDPLHQIAHSHQTDLEWLYEEESDFSKERVLTPSQIQLISKFVQDRSNARARREYDLADHIRSTMDETVSTFFQQESFECQVLIRDVSWKDGGGSTWDVSCRAIAPPPAAAGTKEPLSDQSSESSVLQLAHEALGLASSCSERNVPVDAVRRNDLVLQAKRRLRKMGSNDLRGRKAADAAFWFAVAGVQDHHALEVDAQDINFSLFEALTVICLKELRRFGKRKTCRSIDILHMMERMAAAGVQGDAFQALQRQAVECFEAKGVEGDVLVHELQDKGVLDSMREGTFGLHSHRTLVWVWRFSTRQRKQRAFLESAAKHWESGQREREDVVVSSRNQANYNLHHERNVPWDEIFEDPKRPLVIDIGCGMGISLLGLATLKDHKKTDANEMDVNWSDCNFLGADLSRLAIGYGTSILHRWNLKGKIHLEVSSAQDILEKVYESYPGEVKLIMIQFPTPFRMDQVEDSAMNRDRREEAHHVPKPEGETDLASVVNQGNQQLPTNIFDGFMVTTQLVGTACNILQKSSGRLLLQSNCEDVAVLMKNMAEDVGFQSLRVPFPVKIGEEIPYSNMRIPRRTKQWISMGGERAEGIHWSSRSLLPVKGATETEISCVINGTPVHRCIVYPSIEW